MAKRKRKGIRLIFLFSLFGTASLALAVSILVSTALTRNGYEQINHITDGYINCTKDVLLLDETSDFLTERCREYVAQGKKTSAERYVSEITESQTREKALEHFGLYFADTPVFNKLTSALNYSNELAKTEFYAMRLAADYYGFADVPSRIQSVTLSEEDAAKPAQEKLGLASALVFGDDYYALKTKIDASTGETLNGLIAITTSRKQAASDSISATMIYCDIAGGLLLALLVLMGFSTWILVLRPLGKTKEAIEKESKLEISGSRELRFVASAYNKVYEENEKKKEILLFEVSHDILTGIPNRHDYVDTCNKLVKEEVLFIIADIDHFKQINDTYGHSVGDIVLAEVARRLREAFLNHDRVFRIGGDEFVIMVFEVDSSSKEKLENVLNGINATLTAIHKSQEGFPLVSLSFGVAKKKKGLTFETVYREADKALYSVKEKGGSAVAFDPNTFNK